MCYMIIDHLSQNGKIQIGLLGRIIYFLITQKYIIFYSYKILSIYNIEYKYFNNNSIYRIISHKNKQYNHSIFSIIF